MVKGDKNWRNLQGLKFLGFMYLVALFTSGLIAGTIWLMRNGYEWVPVSLLIIVANILLFLAGKELYK